MKKETKKSRTNANRNTEHAQASRQAVQIAVRTVRSRQPHSYQRMQWRKK